MYLAGFTGNRCISLYSYIKPQLKCILQDLPAVVYLYIPTSNHNNYQKDQRKHHVVYLYIPTSNHNNAEMSKNLFLLYIFIFLHQTTT